MNMRFLPWLASLPCVLLITALPAKAASLKDIGFTLETTIKDYFPDGVSFSFMKGGSILAYKKNMNEIGIFDLESKKNLRVIKVTGMYNTLIGARDSSYVVIHNDDSLRAWDINTGVQLAEIKVKMFNFNPIAFFPDSRRVLLFKKNTSELASWDVADPASVSVIGKSENSNGMAVSPDGSQAAIAAYNIEVYDTSSGKKIRTLKIQNANSVTYSYDGSLIAGSGFYGHIGIWNAKTGKLIRKITDPAKKNISTISISPDNSILAASASGNNDHRLHLWDINTGAKLASIAYGTDGADQVLFSPDGSRLAVGVRQSPFRIEIFQTGMSGGAPISVGIVYIKESNVPLKSSTGKIVTRLPIGQALTVKLRKDGMIFVKAGKRLKGWVPADKVTMIQPDIVGPTIRIIEKTFDEPFLTLKGVVYDDKRVVSLRFGAGKGVRVKRASFEVEKGNFGSVYPFEHKVTLLPGVKPILVATDRGGNIAKVIINIDDPIEKYDPRLSRLRLKRKSVVRKSPAPKARILLSVKKGAELLAVGQRNGWYILEGGGWLPARNAKVIGERKASLGPKRVTLKKKKGRTGPVLLNEGVDVPPDTLTPLDPDAVAVVIGIEKYRDVPGVDFAVRDAKAVHAYLTKAMGFDERNVALLTDSRATKNDLSKYLGRWLKNRVTPKSRVFVFYAGHGAPKPDTGEAYLIPYDGDPNYVKETAFPISRLYKQLGELKAKEVTIVLDACFSGAGGRSVLAKGARPLVMKVTAKPVKGTTLVLAASSGAQISTFDPDAGHGLLTYYLLKGLKGDADRNKDKTITTQELFRYIQPNVERQARRQNVEQTPALRVNEADRAGQMGRVWMRLK